MEDQKLELNGQHAVEQILWLYIGREGTIGVWKVKLILIFNSKSNYSIQWNEQ